MNRHHVWAVLCALCSALSLRASTVDTGCLLVFDLVTGVLWAGWAHTAWHRATAPTYQSKEPT